VGHQHNDFVAVAVAVAVGDESVVLDAGAAATVEDGET